MIKVGASSCKCGGGGVGKGFRMSFTWRRTNITNGHAIAHLNE